MATHPTRTHEPARQRQRAPGRKQVHQDIVVIGASAGGIEALHAVLRGLPAGLPVAVFIVVHVAAEHPSMLPRLLARLNVLPAEHALDLQPIEPGRIYVAPPDHHLLVEAGRVRVVRGPRENGHRPAVDALFRTAARSYGRRVVGVLLSGALDCGSVGLRVIKACGGIAIVQDPNDALIPDMPRNAINAAAPDHVLPAAQIGPLLADLSANGISAAEPVAEPDTYRDPPRHDIITCPDCGGSLTQTPAPEPLRFGCKVGHVYSPESLSFYQGQALEGALWAAVRALKDRADFKATLMQRGDPALTKRYREHVASLHDHASVIERILLTGPENPPDAQVTSSPAGTRRSAPKPSGAKRATMK